MSASPLEMFFSSATHYYICGRFAAFSALVPVAGNLFHHAVEMYLKGGLSKSKSLADLKKLSHELPNVWAEFRAQFEEPLLQQFDDAISALHAFEDEIPELSACTGDVVEGEYYEAFRSGCRDRSAPTVRPLR